MKVIVHKSETQGVRITTSALIPMALSLEGLAERVVPPETDYAIIDVDDLPRNKIFSNAWKLKGDLVIVDLNDAKEICHTKRREVRAAEFAPWDIKATIPAEADHAEKQRQDIRVKYAAIQENIDAAEDISLLGSIHTAL